MSAHSVRLSTTLIVYIARTYIFWLITFVISVIFVIYLIDLIEMLRRTAQGQPLEFTTAAFLSAMKLPFLVQEVIPPLMLFSTMTAVWWLTRSHELIVARALGVSVWQFMFPIVFVGMMVGVLLVIAFNPISASLMERFQKIEKELFEPDSKIPVVQLLSTGIWLQEVNDKEERLLINGKTRDRHQENVIDATNLFFFDPNDNLTAHWTANRVILKQGTALLLGVVDVTDPFAPQDQGDRQIPTNISFEELRTPPKDPETIGFWDIKPYISNAQELGVNVMPYWMWYYKLLALPLLLGAMILLAGMFALRPPRRGGVGILMALGAATALTLYFVNNIVFALGLSGEIPMLLATFGPAGAIAAIGTAAVLHLEDG